LKRQTGLRHSSEIAKVHSLELLYIYHQAVSPSFLPLSPASNELDAVTILLTAKMKHFTTLFLASLVTFVIADDGKDKEKHKDGKFKHHGNMTSDQKSCHRMWKLAHISDTVANSTRMADLQRTNPNRAQRMKDEAVKSGPELQSLSGNQTLAKYCPVLKAHESLKHDCRKLKMAEKIQNKLKNDTAVKGAAEKMGKTESEVKQRWQNELKELDAMKKNGTLVSACGKMKDAKKDGKDGKGKPGAGGSAPEKQKSDAASVKMAGTGAFALGLGLYFAVLLF